MNILRTKLIPIFVASALVYGCGYKLGGLEVIGNNSNKTAAIKIDATKSQIQSFINSGFTIDNDKFDLMVVIDGPNYKKETSSVTSSATENEITLIGSVTMTLKDKNGNLLIEDKEITVSKDYKFSSSSINSSESEETIVRGDIEKYIEIQVINAVRSKL
jgi:outer membrane lipopolysaccharide assembly protein LptE/RlpB